MNKSNWWKVNSSMFMLFFAITTSSAQASEWGFDYSYGSGGYGGYSDYGYGGYGDYYGGYSTYTEATVVVTASRWTPFDEWVYSTWAKDNQYTPPVIDSTPYWYIPMGGEVGGGGGDVYILTGEEYNDGSADGASTSVWDERKNAGKIAQLKPSSKTNIAAIDKFLTEMKTKDSPLNKALDATRSATAYGTTHITEAGLAVVVKADGTIGMEKVEGSGPKSLISPESVVAAFDKIGVAEGDAKFFYHDHTENGSALTNADIGTGTGQKTTVIAQAGDNIYFSFYLGGTSSALAEGDTTDLGLSKF